MPGPGSAVATLHDIWPPRCTYTLANGQQWAGRWSLGRPEWMQNVASAAQAEGASDAVPKVRALAAAADDWCHHCCCCCCCCCSSCRAKSMMRPVGCVSTSRGAGLLCDPLTLLPGAQALEAAKAARAAGNEGAARFTDHWQPEGQLQVGRLICVDGMHGLCMLRAQAAGTLPCPARRTLSIHG